MKGFLRLFWFVVIPLLIGSLIYVRWRHMSLILFRWFDAVGLHSLITYIRSLPLATPPTWVVYNLPDGLWIYAFMNLMIRVWDDRIDAASLPWIVLAPAIAIIGEFGQLAKIIPGTFDIDDIIITLVAIFISISQNKIFKHENEQTEPV